jgi:hypothetical protein
MVVHLKEKQDEIKQEQFGLLWRACLSAAKSHNAGGARPVSDSLIPDNSLTRFNIVWTSSSVSLIALSYGPAPWNDLFYIHVHEMMNLHMILEVQFLLRQVLEEWHHTVI